MNTMRTFLDLIENVQVDESIQEVNFLGTTVRVLCNPTMAQLVAATKRKTMRGLVDQETKATYWWPAAQAIHSSVARELGLEGDLYDTDGIARLEMRGMVLNIISGWRTAIESAFVRYLTAHGVGIKWGKTVISLDEFIARVGGARPGDHGGD